RYGQAEKLGKTVTAAIELRDRAYAEIPYLAEWLSRPIPAGESSDKFDAEINDTLLPLITSNHSLATLLAAGPQAAAEPIAESPAFEQQASQVRERLEGLEQLFAEECARLQTAKKTDGAVLRDIHAALATPLPTSQQRKELRRILDDAS